MGTVRFGTAWDATGFDIYASQPLLWLEAAAMNRRAARIVGGSAIEDVAAMSRYVNTIAAAAPGEARARILRPDEPQLDGPTFFLYGLALENLLKGTLVALEPHLVKGGNLPKKLNSHDLVKLADLAKVTLGETERSVLKVVASCGTSWGRYPIAATVNGMPKGFGYDLAGMVSCLERLYLRFAEALLRAAYPPARTFKSDVYGVMTLDEAIQLDLHGEAPVRPPPK